MKRIGERFVIIALCLGIVIGLGIQGLRAYIADSLIELLDKEAKGACDCQFRVDTVDVSFLTLSATARNPRIESHGTRALRFKTIKAYFSLEKLKDRRVFLDLDLIDGHSEGVDEDSPTVKFISSLAAPLPPERDRPGRWKLKLRNLTASKSTFEQDIAGGKIRGEGFKLSMERDAASNFNMRPHVDALSFSLTGGIFEQTRALSLGGLTADLYLADEQIDFRKVALAFKNSILQSTATLQTRGGDAFSGTFNLLLDSQSLPVPTKTTGVVKGSGTMAGSITAPVIKGSVATAPETPLVISLSDSQNLAIRSAKSEFDLNIDHGATKVSFSNLEAAGEIFKVRDTKPIVITKNGISGAIAFQIDQLGTETFVARGLSGLVSLGGTPQKPQVDLEATSEESEISGSKIGKLITTFHLKDDRIEFTANQPAGLEFLKVSGAIKLSNPLPELELTRISLTELPIGDPKKLHHPYLSGALQIKGPLAGNQLQGSGDLTIGISNSASSVVGTLAIERGNATFKAKGFNDAIEAVATVDFAGGRDSSLSVKARSLAVSSINPALECASLSGALNYSFPINTPLLGSGALDLQNLSLGCEPYIIGLLNPVKLPIQRGDLQLAGLGIGSSHSNLNASGSISLTSGLDFAASGKLELSALIGLLPKLDNISGLLAANLSIKGPFSSPATSGAVSVENGSFWIETAGLSAEHISGTLRLDRDQIKVEDVTGEINSGNFKLSGALFPFDIGKSVVNLNLKNATIDPQKNASLTLSGDINLSQAENGGPQLAGEVMIESGEIQERFDLRLILKALAENLLSRSRVAIRDSQLPNIGLDLHLIGPRNLFLLTNVASGEFAADLTIRGTIASPLISGEVKTLSGWVGLKNRRFDITSGILSFSTNSTTPTVEVLGETNLPSRTGEYVLALLEIRGPLSNPVFKLSSDQGLPESEILALLTQSGTALRGTQANSLSDLSGEPTSGLLEDLASFNLRRLFRGLTRIDSIGIEPIYNQQTGAIEPALVAEKRLARRLNLRGESAFGGTASVSRAKLAYDLTRVLSLEGLVETDPTKRTNPLETNIIYTILARQNKFLSIEMSGADEVSETQILENLRLSESSRVLKSDLSRLESSIKSLYDGLGYKQAHAHVTCEGDSDFCSKLSIRIDEVTPTYVRKVTVGGDPLPTGITESDLGQPSHHQLATARYADRLRLKLTERLRAEGFIGARVFTSFISLPDSNDVELVINVSVGRPVSFTFEGNHVFSAEQFLETINLFQRKQPFGNNTIAILTQNIERLYREAGYLYATVGYETSEDHATGRINYLVTISEERQAAVSSVQIDGLVTISESILREKLTLASPEVVTNIWTPKSAVAEELELHSKQIQEVLVASGYPDARVHTELTPDPSGATVAIRYLISEGAPFLLPRISVDGAPPEIELPSPPTPPLSITNVNEYLDAVLSVVRSAGYLSPDSAISLAPDNNAATIQLSPGTRTILGEIHVEGNIVVSNETILKHLAVESGDAWRSSRLDESRRILLQLGLFSRVDLSPADGKLDSSTEDLLVSVVERPRQTLEVGAGANSEYGAHLFGEASDRGLFADGQSLSFRFDTYWDSVTSNINQGVAGLRYSNPEFLSSGMTLTEDLRFQRLELSTLPYNLDRLSLASYLSSNPTTGLSYSFGHTILEEDLSNVDAGSILSPLDSGLARLSFLSGSIALDHRDNPLNPNSGYYGNLDYRLLARPIASDANVQALSLHASVIEPLPFLSERLRIAFNGKTSSAWCFGNTSEVPITQRYFLGGRTTVRGYKENSLGPRGDDGSIIGGDLLVLGNSELRYALNDFSALHLFLDSGSVFLQNRSVSLGDLRYSSGIGLRYLSPIGPIGVDVGFPINREAGEDAYRLHFTIGNNF